MSYSIDERWLIWFSTTRPSPLWDPYYRRIDEEGNIVDWLEYGNRKSAFGWEVDHRLLKRYGGSDRPSNLRALCWMANAGRQGFDAVALRAALANVGQIARSPKTTPVPPAVRSAWIQAVLNRQPQGGLAEALARRGLY